MPKPSATILQIIPQLDTGGAELSTLEIAEAVIAAGGRAIVLTEGGRLVPQLEAMGADVRIFPAATKNPAKILANASSIAELVIREGVDLIHARSRAPAWSALRAARRTGKPFVTTYHGAYAETSALKRLYNSVMARGDLVIANSGYTRDLIRARYATPDAKIRVIHRGVDGTRFDAAIISPERVAAVRDAWGVDAGTRVILQAARLTSWKGQSVVIAAARALKEQGAPLDAVFVLAGDAQGREAYADGLRAAIADAGLEQNFRLPGHVPDMPAAFLASHLSVVASTEPEAFGRSAVESQAMACPVIATRLGAPPETVRSPPETPASETTGWLVPPGDAGALAQALRHAMSLSPAERTAMGSRARHHALASFSLDSMRRKTLAVYDELLGTRLQAAYVAQRPQPIR